MLEFTSPVKLRLFPLLGTALLCTLLASCGGGNETQSNGDVNTQPAFKPELSLIAGNIGGPGNLDGAGTDARFYEPTGIAFDGAGNMYITDREARTVRRMTPNGVVTTIAGKSGTIGNTDGTGVSARFNRPQDLTVDAAGNIYLIDDAGVGFPQLIRKITPDGVVTTLAGNPAQIYSVTQPEQRDGTGTAAVFSSLQGIAVDASGDLYVTDWNKIRKITQAGVVSTLVTLPRTGGDIAIDRSGNIVVHTGSDISKFTRTGSLANVVVQAGTSGIMSLGNRMTIDAAGHLYISAEALDSDRILKIDAVSGSVTTVLEIPLDRERSLRIGNNGLFGVADMAVDKDGSLFIAGTLRHIIQKVASTSTLTTVAGSETAYGYGIATDGIGANARFGENLPALATDASGNLYLTDPLSAGVKKISPAGEVRTIAGALPGRQIVNGIGSEARFHNPTGITVDAAGNVYVTETSEGGPHTQSTHSSIRKITPAGVTTTFAGPVHTGSGAVGHVDGAGDAARFNWPAAAVADTKGNLYVADGCTVRKVSSTGNVTTFAGKECRSGIVDGFGLVAGIAIDSSENIFVVDIGEQNVTIRKISQTGIVANLAGGAFGNADGKGGEARFGRYIKGGIAVDHSGNVYVADSENHSIRKISQDGIVSTLVGGSVGNRLGTSPSLYYPMGLTLISQNALAITSPGSVLKLTIQ